LAAQEKRKSVKMTKTTMTQTIIATSVRAKEEEHDELIMHAATGSAALFSRRVTKSSSGTGDEKKTAFVMFVCAIALLPIFWIGRRKATTTKKKKSLPVLTVR